MRVLLLGPLRPRVVSLLEASHDTPVPLDAFAPIADVLQEDADWIVSYGYQRILPAAVIERHPHRVLNMHISLLPWNRGKDPNLWSFLEDTPKGVTIHEVDEGLDTGPVLLQESVPMRVDDTLRTSYGRLSDRIEDLFVAHWEEIRDGLIRPRPQPEGGTLHRAKDREAFEALLTQGWDTPVADLVGKALGPTRESKRS